jgi:hypothetical protein
MAKRKHLLGKRKPILILSILTTSIFLGYLFFVSWLSSFLVTKYAAGKIAGEQGRIKSVVVPFGKRRVHFHHWLIALLIIAVPARYISFLPPAIFYGSLSGLIFQGIYCYSDWQKFLITRGQNTKNTVVVDDTEHLPFSRGMFSSPTSGAPGQ